MFVSFFYRFTLSTHYILPTHLRYIQLLKDDEALRLRMGEAGHQSVLSNTIACVAEDLLQWYTLGRKKRANKSALACGSAVALFAFSIPMTVFLLTCYDLVVCPVNVYTSRAS